MKNHYSLVFAAGLALAACEGSKTNTTWQKVTNTRPDKVAPSSDVAAAYANKLHQVLTEANVEHKIVTYQYRYKTALREEAVGTHTAVLYKDDSNPRNPWWLMDDRLSKPVWLPGEEASKQVSFYLRRSAQVVEQKDFSGGEAQAAPTMIAKKNPTVPAGEPAVTRIAKVRPTPAATPPAEVASTEPKPFIRPARFSPMGNEVSIPFTAPAPAGARYDDLFRRTHGTQYDPSSPVDRRKMETIKQARLDTPKPPATRTF